MVIITKHAINRFNERVFENQPKRLSDDQRKFIEQLLLDACEGKPDFPGEHSFHLIGYENFMGVFRNSTMVTVKNINNETNGYVEPIRSPTQYISHKYNKGNR